MPKNHKPVLDVSSCCDHHADQALELFYKASTQPPDDGIWKPHDSLFLRRLVELFTQRGLTRLAAVQEGMARWLERRMHNPDSVLPPDRPAPLMQRWSQADLDLVKLYLEALPEAQYTLADWMLAVDYLVQRYLPLDDLRTEAEWFASRATLMGKVQAQLGDITAKQADRLLSALPATSAAAVEAFSLMPVEQAVLDYGNARCAENVVQLSEVVRGRMRRLVMEWRAGVALGDPQVGGHDLQTRLVDEFAQLNRDWRRIAVTEAGECAGQGLIASLKPGARVRRLERYANACAWCEKINGRVLTVVDPDAQPKDGDTQVWVGKTNLGRSASPYRKVGDKLVPRQPHELWWVAAGVQHPHCRGTWLVEEELKTPEGGNEAFTAWLRSALSGSASD